MNPAAVVVDCGVTENPVKPVATVVVGVKLRGVAEAVGFIAAVGAAIVRENSYPTCLRDTNYINSTSSTSKI